MAYEQRDNSGSFFVNKRKNKPTQPDFNGKAMVGGVMYYMSIWPKQSGGGDEFWSVGFTEIEENASAPTNKTLGHTNTLKGPASSLSRGAKKVAEDELDDEVPF